MAGRVTLIKSIISSIPLHIMQSIQLPASILETFTKLIGQFLWGSNSSKKKLHLVSWKVVIQPPHQNGLGIPDIKLRNSALLMSLAWRFHNRTAYWIRIMKSKYTLPYNNQN